MATREELEELSSEELHDRAVHHARRHANVRFIWRLMRAVPAAEAAVGDMDEAHDDVQSVFGRFDDIRRSREGEVAELLRPMYIDYILEHNA